MEHEGVLEPDTKLVWVQINQIYSDRLKNTTSSIAEGEFRSVVRRDLADNLLDWSLSLLLVCFTSLVDNYLVAEVH